MLIGRGPGDTYLLSAGSAYHSGNGGPWPDIGITRAGNFGHLRLFGIEIDDPGRTVGSLTDYQIEQTGRTLAALEDLCGWDASRIITHQAWTDASYGVNAAGPGPFIGRKGDTLHKSWREWPGSTVAEAYNPIFWRETAQKFRRSSDDLWDGTIPKRSAVESAIDNDRANVATWRVACRLYDLGFRNVRPRPVRKQKYTRAAVIAFQKHLGWDNPHGNFSPATQRRMFGKIKP
jgi:hypothetical protein